MRYTIAIVLLLFVGLIVWSALFTVNETQYAIVTRFGRPLRVIEKPGLNVKWPAPIERVTYFDNRLLVFDVPAPGEIPREFLTEDKKNVEVSSYTCWKIVDPKQFLETVGTRADAEAVLRDVVLSELGRVLGRTPLSGLLSLDAKELQLEALTKQIRDTCVERARTEWGITVVDFRVKRINFPDQNRQSVFERMRAERRRIATRYRSEGEEEATKIRAEAEKTRTEILAEANRVAQETRGRAEAEATRIYADAYGRDPEFYEFIRTLESYTKSLRTGTTILLPADSPYLKVFSNPDAALVAPPVDKAQPDLQEPVATTQPAEGTRGTD